MDKKVVVTCALTGLLTDPAKFNVPVTPGEMADADYGYVGSGPGQITLYRGKEIIKRNIPTEIALDELINLIKQDNRWAEP